MKEKMKRLWKTTNRGLWLGGILLVVLAILICVNQTQMNRQKKLARKTAEAYVADLLMINAVPGTGDEPLTAEEIARQNAALEELISRYWSLKEEKSVLKFLGISETRAQLETWQKTVTYRVNDLEYDVSEIKAYTDSFEIDRACILVYLPCTARLCGRSVPNYIEETLLFPQSPREKYPSYSGDDTDYGYDYEPNLPVPEDEINPDVKIPDTWALQGNFSVNVELVRTANGWRVVSMIGRLNGTCYAIETEGGAQK